MREKKKKVALGEGFSLKGGRERYKICIHGKQEEWVFLEKEGSDPSGVERGRPARL